MFFAKLLGIGTAFRMRARSLGALGKVLGGLVWVRPDLPLKALRYVAGGDDDVLPLLRRSPRAADALGVNAPIDLFARWHGVFTSADALTPEVLFRLGHLLEAAAVGARQHITPPAGMPVWLYLLVGRMHVVTSTYSREGRLHIRVPAEALQQAAMMADQPADLLVRLLLAGPPRTDDPLGVLELLPGMGALLTTQHHVVEEALGSPQAARLAHVLQTLQVLAVPPDPWLPALAACAVHSTKRVRPLAMSLLARVPAPAQAQLLTLLASAESDEARSRAVACLTSLHVPPEMLQARLAVEVSEPVREALRQALEIAGYVAPAAPAPPPLPATDPRAALSAETQEAFRAIVDAYNTLYDLTLRREKGRVVLFNARIAPLKAGEWLRLLQGSAAGSRDFATCSKAGWPHHFIRSSQWYEGDQIVYREAAAFLARPDVTPLHLVRYLVITGNIGTHWGKLTMLSTCADRIAGYARAHGVTLSLRDITAMLQTMGASPEEFGLALVGSFTQTIAWDTDFAWPFYVEHPTVALAALGLGPEAQRIEQWLRGTARKRMLQALSRAQSLPPSLAAVLWEIALGSAKTDRRLAMEALDHQPGSLPRVIAALGSGAYDMRAAAADWLGRLKAVEAVPALQAALKTEKHEVTRAALLNALERLGVPIAAALTPEALAREAAAWQKKGIPDGLAWFPFAALPPVRWAGSDTRVPLEVLQWWIGTAARVGTPEPSPLLRRYADLLHPDDRAALALAVLQAWMTRDLQPRYTRAEAAAEAQRRFTKGSMWQTVEEFTRDLLTEKIGAAGEKGLLALVAAFGDGRIAAPIGRYLKDWYGYRASQCKALVHVLAGSEHPAALQLLLSVATRFRTKGIQQEAEACVQALAERNSWSVDELADRTIPTAGLDDDGTLALPYGARTLTARFTGSAFVLFDGDTPLKALPDARKDDDPAVVKETKAAFSRVKKEVKAVVTLQTGRLYEAMCTGRVWSAEEWSLYLLAHPILGHLCRRLVWQLDGTDRAFRPLDDGTFTDDDDRPVTLPADARVRLAHRATLSEPAAARWAGHLVDYEVAPLFDQLGKPLFTLPARLRDDTVLTDFEGYLVNAFKMRSRVAAQGYARVQGDGMWFNTYAKRFMGLGLSAVIEFSGNILPEENCTVALLSLSMGRMERRPGDNDVLLPVRLGEVPPVLLSECWNDLRLIAADGTGFDKEWEKKVEYQ